MTRLAAPLIVIGGPTAVGKTQLSIDLAKRFGGEIINGDRLQFYRGLDIGTGKVTLEEMQGVPHHALDFLDVDQDYDASQFQALAQNLIRDCHARGVLPVLVGGSGLYLEGLLYDLEFGGKASHDPLIRQALEQRLEAEGVEVLYAELSLQDPVAASKIPIQNHRRLLRALEVMQVTGQKFSDQSQHEAAQARYETCILALDRPRDQLYERINARVQAMVAQGLEAEVRHLYQVAQGQLLPSVQGIGYKEWWPYLAGDITDREAVIAAIQQNSRRYAKRQLTWFRNRIQGTHWLDASDYETALAQATSLVQDLLDKQAEKGGTL
ncbi:tRNA (adenosine(37)-N6)-dimethylallyltransferase MiaA [Abiotrophia defectiva]|uniref:tRNA dimethylallyltransferase n=1 Tax=Abiotrophia defectiva ATCC 49176 TaxID=592010 RepID=W1Q4Q8_ABIDE|nr:tRNA (adenosine(37)-N6)-dimethylallyltransferase MiaA [Abiotrophia defectiva]ESK66156.1 tRNA dimethylallyltransferase [Abiotrophia defectiva ATCC 49176]QKH46436.1 tRNA (adenosine(37)-N6)-dimethylallyltransferase MiaA [Abiotrophia defectiva]